MSGVKVASRWQGSSPLSVHHSTRPADHNSTETLRMTSVGLLASVKWGRREVTLTRLSGWVTLMRPLWTLSTVPTHPTAPMTSNRGNSPAQTGSATTRSTSLVMTNGSASTPRSSPASQQLTP